MSFLPRLSSHAWIIVLLCTCGFLVWINTARIRRVEYVSGLAGTAGPVDPASPTGYAAGLRQLIVPEHNNDSYQWIAQTQQMLARGEWRIRHIDYDNAPFGREVRSPSPYRWWLGLVAWFDHAASGRPLGQSVERAAIWADPLLHLLLLASVAVFTAWQFGNFPAALLALALAATFPFGGAFLPGQPNDSGLAQAWALWSVLPLLAGLGPRQTALALAGDPQLTSQRMRRWFFAAGFAGGIGLWVSVAKQLPVLAGLAVGGLLTAWLARRAQKPETGGASEIIPWRSWGLGGAIACLAAGLLEYFPAHLGGLRLDTVHPLFGLAWLGAAELLARASAKITRQAPVRQRHAYPVIILAVLAVGALPVLMVLTDDNGFMATDALAARLSSLSDTATAQNILAWVARDGFNLLAAATCLPLLLLVPAVWLLIRRDTDATRRTLLALALGTALVVLVPACLQLRWWNTLEGLLLVLLAALTTGISSGPNSRRRAGLWLGGVGLGLIPGAMLLAAQVRAAQSDVVNEGDVEALVERDLAHWLANQSGPGGAVVLAPPNLATSVFFHGGLAVLGTPYWENKDGFTASIRIAGASSPDEAQAVANSRGLTHIIIPSWDPFLDEYARLGATQVDHSLMASLHGWLPPRWLRPVPYRLPAIAGFEGQSVVIFKVVEVQDNAIALSHLAEYFVEMGQTDQAAAVAQALEHYYPTELSAVVARALVARARTDAAAFTATLNELQAALTRGDNLMLPWDRRVSLAIALVEGKKFAPAREEVQRCLAELDEPRLRSLTTDSLYRLQVMGKAFGLTIPDQRLRELARTLLPVELRRDP